MSSLHAFSAFRPVSEVFLKDKETFYREREKWHRRNLNNIRNAIRKAILKSNNSNFNWTLFHLAGKDNTSVTPLPLLPPCWEGAEDKKRIKREKDICWLKWQQWGGGCSCYCCTFWGGKVCFSSSWWVQGIRTKDRLIIAIDIYFNYNISSLPWSSYYHLPTLCSTPQDSLEQHLVYESGL